MKLEHMDKWWALMNSVVNYGFHKFVKFLDLPKKL